jgi:Fe-S cluster assembly iron-binding protein IscA
MNFSITPATQKLICMAVFSDGGPDCGFRLEANPGGYRGPAEDFSLRKAPQSGEEVVETDRVRLFVAAESCTLLAGATTEFEGIVVKDLSGSSQSQGNLL